MPRFPRHVSSLGIGLLISALGGCAGVRSGAVDSPGQNGIRYYAPATYYLVKPDYSKGSMTVTQWTGPDTTHLYTLDPYAVMSKNNTEITFDHGVLSKVTNTADTTKLATDTIGAADEITKQVLQLAQSAAKAAAGVAAKEAGPAAPPVYLYVATRDGISQLFPPVH